MPRCSGVPHTQDTACRGPDAPRRSGVLPLLQLRDRDGDAAACAALDPGGLREGGAVGEAEPGEGGDAGLP